MVAVVAESSRAAARMAAPMLVPPSASSRSLARLSERRFLSTAAIGCSSKVFSSKSRSASEAPLGSLSAVNLAASTRSRRGSFSRILPEESSRRASARLDDGLEDGSEVANLRSKMRFKRRSSWSSRKLRVFSLLNSINSQPCSSI